MIKVEGEKGLVRDPVSKAIIQTDVEALRIHRQKRAMLKKAAANTDRLEKLENDVQEIKQMLLELINK